FHHWPAVHAANESHLTARPGGDSFCESLRHLNRHSFAGFLSRQSDSAPANMGAPEAAGIPAAESRFSQNLEREALARSKRPLSTVDCNILVRPRRMSLGCGRDYPNALGRIRGHESAFDGPIEKPTQRVDEMSSRRGCRRALVPAPCNVAPAPRRELRVAKGGFDSLEDVFPLALRREARGAPCLRFAVKRQAPRERSLSRAAAANRARFPFQCGVIGGEKFSRVELAGHPDSRPLALPEIPDGLAVSSDLTVKERRKFARHVCHMGCDDQ